MRDELRRARETAARMLGERSRREGAWKEARKWICPWRGRFAGDEDAYDRGGEELALFTGAASQSVLRGASGITSGMTPRNISWFKPAFADDILMEAAGARRWLDELDSRMKDCLSRGGFYQAIQNFNTDLLWAGCALLYAERDAGGLRYESVQIGTFCVSLDKNSMPAAVSRTLNLTVSEAARIFGRERLTEASASKLERDPFATIEINHFVRDEDGKISSLWYESGSGDKLLRKSFYYEMPYFFANWNDGATPYGTGPGDECLADARQMDLLERHKLAGLGRLSDPPVVAHPSLKDAVDLEPGGITWANENMRIEPLLDLSPYAQAMRWLQEEIQVVRQRLDQGLMASIFASIPLDQRPRDMSATEFLERKREALQQLGPVISAYEPRALIPCLFRTLHTLYRAGEIPPPPENLEGLDLPMKIEFVSPLANALRQTSAETARALFQSAAEIFQATRMPEVFDKVDVDQLIDELATGLGAPGSIIRSDEEVAEIRERRRQEEARRAEAMLMESSGERP